MTADIIRIENYKANTEGNRNRVIFRNATRKQRELIPKDVYEALAEHYARKNVRERFNIDGKY